MVSQRKRPQYEEGQSLRIFALYGSGVPRNFFREGGGVQQIQLRTEDRENRDLWAVAP